MAYKKCKCPPEGAPQWVMTFGDMMSLLLTFFVLLLSLSEVKKESEFRAVVKEVKKAFGIHGGGGKVPTPDDPALSFIDRIESLQKVSRRHPQPSQVPDPGMQGKRQQVTTVRQKLTQITGGRLVFEPGLTRLTETHRKKLIQLATQIRGFNTKIHVNGHADTAEIFDPKQFENIQDLSYRRARVVGDFLISKECRIRPQRIKLIAKGDSEKVKWAIYQPTQLQSNRRVEIQVSNMLVDELTTPELDRSN